EDGTRNPAFCGGLEHKMGIKGSATCVMNFEGAKGWLIGEPNKGLKCMFTMMNSARLMVGMQGLGIAESAYQISLGFAKERLQSRSLSGPKAADKPADPILVHPDVRRMLLRQKVLIEGCRALAYFTGLHLDVAHDHEDAEVRQQADDLVQLLTPVVKAFLTDEGFTCANEGLQVLGGSGFTEDWGIEQLVRDCRITRLYECTNGIQALVLVGRRLAQGQPRGAACGCGGQGAQAAAAGHPVDRQRRHEGPRAGRRRLGALPAPVRPHCSGLAVVAHGPGGTAEAGAGQRRNHLLR